MKLFYCLCLLAPILLATKKKNSNQSYIQIAWQGEVNKPYHEIFFCLENSCDKDDRNTLRHYFTVSNKQLQLLSDSIFTIFEARRTAVVKPPLSGPIFYFVTSFKQDKGLYTRPVGSKEELAQIRQLTERLFRGTAIEKELEYAWQGIYGRLQMTAHNRSG